MTLIDLFISKLAPYNCLGCGNEGKLLCGICAANGFRRVPERCYRCRKVSPRGNTCPSCRRISKLKNVQVAVVYEGLAKELVWRLKFEGVQAAADEMGRRMLPLMRIDNELRIVPVPTASGRSRRRGYDQAKLLARELSRQSQLPYADCLRRSGQAHQVGASRKTRLNQLASSFRVVGHRQPQGRIILVDDVITTGATLEAAAAALKRAGVKRIEAIIFAQP